MYIIQPASNKIKSKKKQSGLKQCRLFFSFMHFIQSQISDKHWPNLKTTQNRNFYLNFYHQILLNKGLDNLSVAVFPVISQDALAEKEEEAAAKAKQKNQEAPLHVVHVNCVVDDFNNWRLFRTSVLGWHVFLDPPLNQSHLVKSSDLRVEKVQVRRVFWQNYADLFFHELFVAQCKVAAIGFQVFASHDVQKIGSPVDIHVSSLPDLVNDVFVLVWIKVSALIELLIFFRVGFLDVVFEISSTTHAPL